MENIFENHIKPEALKLMKRAKVPKDYPGVITKWTNVYLNELNKLRYALNEKGEAMVIDSEGNPVENDHGWPMSGQDAIKDIFNLHFEDNGLPETEAEVYKKLGDPNVTPEQRIALTKSLEDIPKGEDSMYKKRKDKAYKRLTDPDITVEERIALTNLLRDMP